jgi:TctA family transporter
MCQQGRAGIALSTSAISSAIGGLFGILIIILLSPYLLKVAFEFGPSEYFSIMTMGLVAVCCLTNHGNIARNLAMVLLGMLLGLVGIDLNTSTPRFMFGNQELADGINIALVAMGLFGLPEIMHRIITWKKNFKILPTGRMYPNSKEYSEFLPAAVRGSAVGGVFGPLPGTGPAVAGFMSYLLEKLIRKKSTKFGKGEIRGVAAPEAANNSGAQTEFVPTMLLGLPGDTAMPLILAALVMHGVTPGPSLINSPRPIRPAPNHPTNQPNVPATNHSTNQETKP